MKIRALDSSCCMQKYKQVDRRTDMTKLIIVFFAILRNAPKKDCLRVDLNSFFPCTVPAEVPTHLLRPSSRMDIKMRHQLPYIQCHITVEILSKRHRPFESVTPCTGRNFLTSKIPEIPTLCWTPCNVAPVIQTKKKALRQPCICYFT